jgi:hypothetical protein
MHDDGFLDLFLGWMLLAGFLRDATGVAHLTVLQLAGVPFFWLGKRFITVPRMGVVKFGPRRQARRKWIFLILSLSVLIMAAVYALAVTGAVPQLGGRLNLINAGVTVMILGVFAALAWQFGLARLYLIGIVFAATNVARVFTDSPLIFLAAGMVITVVGLTMLVRFLQRYPVPHEQPGTP